MQPTNRRYSKEEAEHLADTLYEQYAKPLEAKHRGKFVAVSPEGKTLLGDTFLEVATQATQQFGPGNFIFKLGEEAGAAGKWR